MWRSTLTPAKDEASAHPVFSTDVCNSAPWFSQQQHFTWDFLDSAQISYDTVKTQQILTILSQMIPQDDSVDLSSVHDFSFCMQFLPTYCLMRKNGRIKMEKIIQITSLCAIYWVYCSSMWKLTKVYKNGCENICLYTSALILPFCMNLEEAGFLLFPQQRKRLEWKCWNLSWRVSVHQSSRKSSWPSLWPAADLAPDPHQRSCPGTGKIPLSAHLMSDIEMIRHWTLALMYSEKKFSFRRWNREKLCVKTVWFWQMERGCV